MYEIIQKRATKWIFSEPYVSYEDNEYLLKLKSIELLPIGYKFLYTDLSFFHRVVHGSVCTKLPSYLNLAIPKRTGRHRIIHEHCPLGIHLIFQCLTGQIELLSLYFPSMHNTISIIGLHVTLH